MALPLGSFLILLAFISIAHRGISVQKCDPVLTPDSMARVLLGILVFDSFSLLQGWKLMFLLNEFAETKSQLLVHKTQRKVDDFSWEKK